METERKHKERLIYRFSNDERLDMSSEIARVAQKLDELKGEKKQVAKDYDAQIAGQEASMMILSRKISNGYEMRETECATWLNQPRIGMKTIIRLDSGEVVREVKMEPEEMQETLPLDDKPAA